MHYGKHIQNTDACERYKSLYTYKYYIFLPVDLHQSYTLDL